MDMDHKVVIVGRGCGGGRGHRGAEWLWKKLKYNDTN